jgi:hypothetical protein
MRCAKMCVCSSAYVLCLQSWQCSLLLQYNIKFLYLQATVYMYREVRLTILQIDCEVK